MGKQWCYFMFLLWLSYLIVSGVLMFMRGFLLAKVAQKDNSTCARHTSVFCTLNNVSSLNITNGHTYKCSEEDKILSLLRDINSASKVCLPQRSNVVLIIIDALKYEFAAYDDTLIEPQPYQNKIPVINELLEKFPNHSRLYKFIADPPTTTMQRLKSLTTGSLPTFVDIGSNFATTEIVEDNIIDQTVRNDKRIVFMGDDTWLGLYPGRFTRYYPFPSFNVWDLDTVDSGIVTKLIPEIEKNDWNMIVAHFLGVDHCGHRYGPFHSEMTRKLREMNDVIKSVVETINNETVLIVIGDHGMTNTGDHGGDSEAEVTAAMFVYSPKPLIKPSVTIAPDTVKQVDIVPTLSLLLGIPVPFSNLGSIIFDSIPVSNSRFQKSLFEWHSLLIALWSNVEQTKNYIEKYSKTTGQFDYEQLELLKLKYKHLRTQIQMVNNEEKFNIFALDAKSYIEHTRQMCEDIWIQFDSFSMSRGLLLMFLTIFFVYMIVDGIPIDRLPEIFMSSFLACSYGAVAVAALGSVLCYYLSLVENLELTLFFSTGMASVFMLAMLVIQNWEIIAIHWYDCTKSRDWIGISCRIVLLLSMSGLFSNSYVVEEGTVLSFLILTLVWILVYNSGHKEIINNKKLSNDRYLLVWFKSQWSSTKTKLIVMGITISFFIRLSLFFWRCREEQSFWCDVVNSNQKNLSVSTARLETIISLICLASFVTITRIWLRSCGNLVGFSPSVTIARYMPSVIVVCIGGFWVLYKLPKETKNKLIAPWQVDVFSWIIYANVTIALICIFIQPLCVYIIPRKIEMVSVYGHENIIPQLFNHVKGLYKDKNIASNQSDTPIVCGLGTVYSAVFVVLSVFVLLLFTLLLGDSLAPSSVIMYFSGVIVLTILSVTRYEKATNIEQLFDVSGTSILCWVLLCDYFFYGTGHQPAFPNIHWDAAFIGTGGNFVTYFIPATLIIINTFGSHILFGITLPLLLIAPFTLYVMFPNLSMLKTDEKKEMKRGELMLYERDKMLLNGVFTICCKYILFHGIRMFVCMLAATIHCRHLMVWKIFAPKLIFEGVGMFVTLPAVLVGYLFLVRTNYRVDRLIIGLDKQAR